MNKLDEFRNVLIIQIRNMGWKCNYDMIDNCILEALNRVENSMSVLGGG